MVVQQGKAVVVVGPWHNTIMQFKLSIIVPTFNESENIVSCLDKLQTIRKSGSEVIVVDGGSTDDTIVLAEPLCDQIIQSRKSRSIQMNAGAKVSSGQCTLFLHADTTLPSNTLDLFSRIDSIESKWGRFDIKLSGEAGIFRVIEKCINLRSRLSGIATGDQAIFIGKTLYSRINGFPEIALMEDIAVSKILKTYSSPVCIRDKVITSSRRWEKHGIIKTILKMWFIRLLYFFRFNTNSLARLYS
jgi:rSAM/selenodomain-associated transferase 2